MRVLMSVWDKAGLLPFAKGLAAQGAEILSTGGTLEALEKEGIPVTQVSDITGFPECLDGRVKTLHPAIHAGLLAMRSNPEHMQTLKELDITPIDMVVVNLYPFRQTICKPDCTLELAIENIDIGGPTMLRAAAKNWQDVVVLTDPADYDGVLRELTESGAVSLDTKRRLCYKVFALTAQYDALIADYLLHQLPEAPAFPEMLTLPFEKVQEMRYGENPHQNAAFYKELQPTPGCLTEARQLHGKELSFNNINDTNGALDLLREFAGQIAVVAVKHANPCGVGVADAVEEAYRLAYESDPKSIYGGIVVTNTEVNAAAAEQMSKIFLEIVVATHFTPEAMEILTKKKNIRLLELDTTICQYPSHAMEMKKVAGGLLVQEMNDVLLPEEKPQVVTQAQPTEEDWQNMMLAWRIVKHTKSNGIAIAKDNQSLGIGPGQVNRVWAAESAIIRSGEKVKGAAMASDAYFPFPDSIEAAARAGIAAIIQPGGSINDKLVIEACDKYGIAMVFTGMRHFKH